MRIVLIFLLSLILLTELTECRPKKGKKGSKESKESGSSESRSSSSSSESKSSGSCSRESGSNEVDGPFSACLDEIPEDLECEDGQRSIFIENAKCDKFEAGDRLPKKSKKGKKSKDICKRKDEVQQYLSNLCKYM